MSLELWFTYVVTYTVISLVPGPSVLMIIGQTLTHGKRAAFLCILGDIFGGFLIIALSLFGVGAILAASSELFQIVKWAGVLYMIFMGVSQLTKAHSRNSAKIPHPNPVHDLRSIRTGFLIGALNPKAIVFYVAFLAQFLEPDGNIMAQFTILIFSSSAIVALVLGGYVLVAAKAGQTIKNPKSRQYIDYAGGGFFVGGGIYIAITR